MEKIVFRVFVFGRLGSGEQRVTLATRRDIDSSVDAHYSPVAWTLGPVRPRQGLQLHTRQGKPASRQRCGVPGAPLDRKKLGRSLILLQLGETKMFLE